jgi:C-terminal processing protease CtpA/Prc
LNNEIKPYAKFTSPDINYPGIFLFSKPYHCGQRNRKYYKGKIVLLVNERTQSRAEFICMALQTAPDVTTIGSQTAGVDGNVSLITFPGNYSLHMSGLGVYYPDGKETQRIGIVPDIEVKPTIKGIQEHKDEVLDRAFKYLDEGK